MAFFLRKALIGGGVGIFIFWAGIQSPVVQAQQEDGEGASAPAESDSSDVAQLKTMMKAAIDSKIEKLQKEADDLGAEIERIKVEKEALESQGKSTQGHDNELYRKPREKKSREAKIKEFKKNKDDIDNPSESDMGKLTKDSNPNATDLDILAQALMFLTFDRDLNASFREMTGKFLSEWMAELNKAQTPEERAALIKRMIEKAKEIAKEKGETVEKVEALPKKTTEEASQETEVQIGNDEGKPPCAKTKLKIEKTINTLRDYYKEHPEELKTKNEQTRASTSYVDPNVSYALTVSFSKINKEVIKNPNESRVFVIKENGEKVYVASPDPSSSNKNEVLFKIPADKVNEDSIVVLTADTADTWGEPPRRYNPTTGQWEVETQDSKGTITTAVQIGNVTVGNDGHFKLSVPDDSSPQLGRLGGWGPIRDPKTGLMVEQSNTGRYQELLAKQQRATATATGGDSSKGSVAVLSGDYFEAMEQNVGTKMLVEESRNVKLSIGTIGSINVSQNVSQSEVFEPKTQVSTQHLGGGSNTSNTNILVGDSYFRNDEVRSPSGGGGGESTTFNLAAGGNSGWDVSAGTSQTFTVYATQPSAVLVGPSGINCREGIADPGCDPTK